MFTLVEIALSVGVLTTLVTVLSACVCGCKNSNQKSELVGTAGVVKIRFDEEAPSPSPTTPASVKRASTQNSQRSLPEIPQPVGRHDSGDTASEIYATVNLDEVEGNKALATTSSRRDHPYEHAYAKLQNQADTHNVTVEIAEPPSAEAEARAASPGPDAVVISASGAVSGALPSSHELPYITPPRDASHFSTDSTDSAKGYTSISVREPLSNIRAQSKAPIQPHYATVSDDSDEMYAAIEEASAGEGSDTYAQIAPEPRRRAPAAPAPAAHAPPAHDHARRSAPPEIGGASTSNATHTREESSSSSSLPAGALGSPKPEKRSANSPLPPPPPAPHPHPAQQRVTNDRRHQRISSTGDLLNQDKLRRSLNEKHQRNNSCVSSSDFYGCNYPVEKHRFSSGDLIRPLVAKELDFDIDNDHNLYNSIEGHNYSDYSSDPNATADFEQRVTESPSRNVEEMYAKVMKRAKNKDEKTKDAKYRDDPGYETIDRKANHGYETIARKERKISNQDPGYETVKDISKNAFSNNNLLKNHIDSGPNSLVSSDAGYEHISKVDNNASDSDPNYEVLRSQPPGSSKPTNNNSHDVYTAGSESDPNYESVRPKDPNYESANPHDPNYESLRCKDPKYESVRSKNPAYDSVRSKNDPNYESVKYYELANTEPPYERLSSELERSDSSAGYEKINVPNNRDAKISINSGADGTVSDYFQV